MQSGALHVLHVSFGFRQMQRKRYVRFTPESGHVQCNSSRLLWANSGLMQCSKGLLFDRRVGAGEQ